MSEEEIIQEGLKAVPEYQESIRVTGEFILDRCVAMEVKRLERLYRLGLQKGIFGPLSKKDLQSMDAFTAHFIPLLTERTLPIQQKYMQQRRISVINATTAKVIVTEEFNKVGLHAVVFGQKYRAKVLVEFPGVWLRFYIRYKGMMDDGVMEAKIKAVLDLKNAADRLGYGVTLTNK